MRFILSMTLLYLELPLQVRNEFYKDTQGALLVYDVTNRASFEALSDWLIEMRAHLTKPQDLDSIVFVVCANKVRHKLYCIISYYASHNIMHCRLT